MHVTAHYHMGINYDEWKGHVFTAESAFDNKHLTRVRDKDCVKNRVKRANIVRSTLC